MARSLVGAAVGVALLAVGASAAVAEDGWNPFKERDQPRRTRPAPPAEAVEPRERLPPMGGVETPPWDRRDDSEERSEPAYGPYSGSGSDQPAPWSQAPRENDRLPTAAAPSESVQRGELQPVMAADGSGLPQEMWQGLDAAQLQEMIAPLAIPPRSAALASLWRRLWAAESGPPPDAAGQANGTAQASFTAVRIEALYRSGLMTDLTKVLGEAAGRPADPITSLLSARANVLLGNREAGCSEVKGLQRTQGGMPKPMRQEFLILAALCGAADRDAGAAGLAAELLRAEGIDAPVPLAALDALASGARGSVKPPAARTVGLLDYRFLELAGVDQLPNLMASAEPALLTVLASSSNDIATRVLAGEAAASLHALSPAELAAVYRAAPLPPQAAAEPFADRSEPPLKRAILYKAFEGERTPIRKARLARALLDEVRRAHGPYMETAAMLAPALESLQPAPEIGWFAETAIEVNLAAGRYDAVRRWAEPPLNERFGSLRHWLVLADIADPQWRGRRGEDLPLAEQFAVRGRLAPELMHRLVTVLDALDYQIPIPLWEAASRSPQPSTGHLPATGILSQMQDAAKQKAHARVVLMAMRTLGPDSGETAHIIALGDTVRALKRAGLEPGARRLGLEALFAAWPRSAHN